MFGQTGTLSYATLVTCRMEDNYFVGITILVQHIVNTSQSRMFQLYRDATNSRQRYRHLNLYSALMAFVEGALYAFISIH